MNKINKNIGSHYLSGRVNLHRQEVINPYTEQDLVNPYRPDITFRNFPDLQSKMESYYDLIYDTAITGSRKPMRFVYELGKKIAFRDAFYYIDSLYDNDPTSVVDVGSGNCFWKKWFPNIIAVDSGPQDMIQPDIIANINDDWCRNNFQKYDVGINICGARWGNDTMNVITSQMSIVKDRFLFTFGMQNLNVGVSADHYFNLNYLIDQIMFLSNHYRLLMLDVPELRGFSQETMNKHAHINGAVRFILAHR